MRHVPCRHHEEDGSGLMDEAAIRADERDKIAHYILAELVCCDIFERMEAAGQADDLAKISANDPNGQWHQLRWGPEYHAMCRYAGWAASLAKEGPKHDTRGAVRPPV